MKVLWIVNSLFPEAQQLLFGKSDARGGGGWLYSLANELIKQPGLDLYIAASSVSVRDLVPLEGERIHYYVFPFFEKKNKYIPFMQALKQEVKPDVVNIHGTEYPFGYYYVKACGSDNVVVTVQGVISEIAKYYAAGLTRREILRDITLRDVLRQSIYGEQKEFRQRGRLEVDLIKKVKHVIGRTEFDKAHILSMNPSVTYHYCSETLREEFYTGRWSIEKCVPHSIFISQAWYPIKGAHVLFRALPILIKKYPDLKVVISGTDLTEAQTVVQKIKEHGYSKILKRYIREYSIEKNVVFVGPLSASEMKEQLLRSNVFVCPSSIENSSNSLCEAQMLGVPCVASFVGGLPSLVVNNNCYLYRFEDSEMLAYFIEKCFMGKQIPSDDEVQIIHERHNLDTIAETMLEIYKKAVS